MVPTITNPLTQLAASALFAVLLLSMSAAVLRADENRSARAVDTGAKHCRIYFGCLPDLAKMRGPLN